MILLIYMDPLFPLGTENKQAIWQKLINLPLKVKLAIMLTVVIILGSAVAAFILWRISHQTPPSAVEAPKTEQLREGSPADAPANETGPDDTTKSEEQKRQEEAANNDPAPAPKTNLPSTGGGGSGTNTPSGNTTPSPSGSSRPNASNTGPTGTLTSTYSGAASNGNSNQTFENMSFPAPGSPGYYIFSGNNLSFRNCYIQGDGVLFNGDNITFENCIVEGGVSLSGTNGVTFRYNEVRNFSGDGIHLTSDSGQAANVTISHNYIHSPTPNCGDHADGMQIRGVNTLNLYNNNFDMGPWVQVCGQDALNAAIFFESANGGNSNLTVESNYLNGAGITLRLNPGSNQKIINNRFGRDYKYSTVSNQTNTGNITQKSGNVMDDDGSAVNF